MNAEKRRLIANIAYLYYVEGKTQTEISQQLDIYRTTVCRLLSRAKKKALFKLILKTMTLHCLRLKNIHVRNMGSKG